MVERDRPRYIDTSLFKIEFQVIIPLMKTYEAGRESSILQDVLNGNKTIECRLNKGKFAKYQPGDHVWLREDIYKDGVIVESKPKRALVEVVKTETYPTFRAMFETIGYDKAIPRAASVQEALSTCYQFYTREQEKELGVIAVYFKLLQPVS